MYTRAQAQEKIDKITDTKCDHEFCVSAGREPNQYTAGVQIWECEDSYFLSGYWDMPHATEKLGTSHFLKGTPIVDEKGNISFPEMGGDLPLNVLQAAQAFLLLGLEIMDEQGIRVTKAERQVVLDMCEREELSPFRDFMRSHQKHHCPENLRYGQWLMNELAGVKPELYRAILNTDADCFYFDSKINDFVLVLCDSWID